MSKYTAINIGPIIPTFNMVRRPRDLWAASYMFSHLMKCIIDFIQNEKGPKDIKVFSPIVNNDEKNGVGLFPDRVYCTGEWSSFQDDRITILKNYAKELGKPDDKAFIGYFNIMCATTDVEAETNENSKTKAIRELNHLLDCLELNGRATSRESTDVVWKFISSTEKNTLYNFAFEKSEFANANYLTLAQYASIQLSTIDCKKWKEAQVVAGFINDCEHNVKQQHPEYTPDFKEDTFFQKIKDSFSGNIKSYHKYICLVQADGDNMGKTFSHKDLNDDKTSEISEKLVQFGKDASRKIYEYGGLPIYAGGDDLLFLAPVVGISEGKTETYNKNIFDLLNEIDNCFNPVKREVTECRTSTGEPLKDDKGNAIVPSMSYGVSITYYKFPLYEALASAQHLLFDVAKNVDGKNAIAWRLQKNSGSSFEGAFTKDELLGTFENVILKSAVKDTIVAAVSHKIRENQQLLQLWLNKEEKTEQQKKRNLNFFKKYMDYDEKNPYKTAILDLLNKMYEVYSPLFEVKENEIENKAKEIKILQTDKAQGIFTVEQKKEALKQALRDDMFKMVYSMIRTAKFISGEEVKDE